MQKLRSLVSGILLVAATLTGAVDAGAEGKSGAAEAAVVEKQPAIPRPSGAAFMKPLSRLATILGSVHFLRGLCGDENAAIWRDRMNDILTAQAPSQPDKEALVASFNSGYRTFASVYRRCTPAARVAAARYQKEGVALSRDIAARYGN